MRVLALPLLMLSSAASAADLSQCGLTARLCTSGATEVKRTSTADDGSETRRVTPQLWSPWSVVVDPQGPTITVRWQYGGADMLDDGKAPGDAAERTHTYAIVGCAGSVGTEKVTLEVPPAENIELYFSAGQLVRVVDPSTDWLEMRTQNGKEEWSGQSDRHRFFSVRDVVRGCPGKASAGTAPAAGGSGKASGKKGKAKAAVSAPSDERGFESATSTPGPQDRATTTGEQGGAAGAKEVDFGTQREACKDKCKEDKDACFWEQEPLFKSCLDNDPDCCAPSVTDRCERQTTGTCHKTWEKCFDRCTGL